jgi:hypothetical protein
VLLWGGRPGIDAGHGGGRSGGVFLLVVPGCVVWVWLVGCPFFDISTACVFVLVFVASCPVGWGVVFAGIFSVWVFPTAAAAVCCGGGGVVALMESLILAQDERWRRA